MPKERLLLSNIVKDLKIVANFQISIAEDWRLAYISPITILSVVSGLLLKNLWIALLIFAFAAYHIIRYVYELNRHSSEKRAIMSIIDRGDISVSVERFSHISAETVYEPHLVGVKAKRYKTAIIYHFASGGSWRCPRVDKHYKWSKDYYVSPKGLENISIPGDEFLRISLQGYNDIAYIYPCKNFVFDEEYTMKM